MKSGQLTKLRESIRASVSATTEFRRRWEQARRQYAGPGYVRDRTMLKRPLNLMAMIVDAHMRFLIANSPRGNVTTTYRQLRPEAYTLELGLNHLVQQIRLEDTLRLVFKDGMFGAPAVKIGLALDAGDDDFTKDAGQVFVSEVLTSNFIFDMNAERYEQVAWVGDRHFQPLDYVKSRKSPYGRKATKNLTATDYRSNLDGRGLAKASDLSRGKEGAWFDDFREVVELYDVWIPHGNKIVTFAAQDETGGEALREEEWDGPPHGPYHRFSYDDVPGNVLPKPPAFDWMDLEDAENRLLRKMIQQAERQKTNVLVQGDDLADGARLRDAADGEMIPVGNSESAKEVRYGGIDNLTMQAVVYFKQLISWAAGNLDSLAGLGTMSDTATQDRLLHDAASEKLRDMQKRCYYFTKCVMEDVAWYMRSDPYLDLPLTKRVADVEIPVQLTMDKLRGEYFQYNFDVEPYSMQPRSPGEKLQFMTNVLDKLIAMGPMAQQSGVVPNIKKWLHYAGRYGQMHEIEELIEYTGAEPDERKPIEPRQAAQTTRTNVRKNVSRTSPDQQMMQSLMANGRSGSNQFSNQ